MENSPLPVKKSRRFIDVAEGQKSFLAVPILEKTKDRRASEGRC